MKRITTRQAHHARAVRDVHSPLVAAPMSGGPTTPAMVSAATRAGGLGMLAAGDKTRGGRRS